MRTRHTPEPDDFLPLRPVELEILVTLAAGERHGYAIIQETDARTDGSLRLETGTLYRALHRLVKAGLAKPTARRAAGDSEDERRRYYAITDLGRRVAAAEAARLSRLVAAARAANLLPLPRPT
jgi:DNA-binding PadR family transcriptional regulator